MAKVKHGGCGTRLYSIWKDMRKRCNNPKFIGYKYYGAKGVKVCDEWNDFAVFRDWALSHGYNDNLTIDRKDYNGNYKPENCRWITTAEQNLNTSQNTHVEIDGKTKTVTEWAREYGLNVRSILWRYEKGLRGKDLIAPKKISMQGKHHSEESKRKISESTRGEKAYWYGKKRSAETIRKMSEANKGKVNCRRIILKKDELEYVLKLLRDNTPLTKISELTGYKWGVIKRIKIENEGVLK